MGKTFLNAWHRLYCMNTSSFRRYFYFAEVIGELAEVGYDIVYVKFGIAA